jgi:hypothetical protein
LSEIVGRRLDELAVLALLGLNSAPTKEKIGDRDYVELKARGISLVLRNDHVLAVQLHAGGRDSFSRYDGPIMGGATFEMTRDDLRNLLGVPQRSGEATTGILGKMPPWDRWSLGGVCLHAEYEADTKGVRLFTMNEDRN